MRWSLFADRCWNLKKNGKYALRARTAPAPDANVHCSGLAWLTLRVLADFVMWRLNRGGLDWDSLVYELIAPTGRYSYSLQSTPCDGHGIPLALMPNTATLDSPTPPKRYPQERGNTCEPSEAGPGRIFRRKLWHFLQVRKGFPNVLDKCWPTSAQ